uniref:F-box and leucine rich repeat protein n=1 Tax=Salmo trutta TaxID=8032 RepID=A0A673XMH4_SALTR
RTSITQESLRSVAQVEGLSLEELRLRGCKELTHYSVEVLCKHQPGLQILDLSACTELTNLSVGAIATYLPGLVVLRLGWCKEITDWGLLDMVEPTKESEPNKEMVREGWVGKSYDHAPLTEGASLLALRSLQDLDLSACSKLTDSSITQVLCYPDLQRLSLSMLPEISDDSLASVAYHCHSLTSLELSHCPHISDQGITRAAPYLARLQHLYLSCCNCVTAVNLCSHRSLSMLVQHCKRLRTLDISMCKHISLTTVELLQSQLPFIENVHCRFVGGADLTLLL